MSLFFPFVSFFARSVNEVTEVKHKIVWDEVSDDHLDSHGNIFEKYSIEIRADFLSCNTISCDIILHLKQMDYLYSALVKLRTGNITAIT